MKKKISKGFILEIAFIIASYVLLTILMKSGMLNRQYTALIVPVGVNIMLAVSLNLVTGFLGELSLGHACFMSIGAYTGALISTSMELPSYAEFFLALIAGGVMAAVFGFLIGVPVLRLHGDYLAIVTLAFGEIVKSVLNALPFTNGSKGLSKIPMYSNYQHYTLVFILVILTIVIITNLVKSRHGRAICSLRDNYIASESIGIPVSRFKVLAFVIGAFFAGIAGVIYAHNVGIIKPTTFDYNKSIEILVIVVLGGMGSIKGSIIAAVILTVLPEMLRGADDYRMLLYSIVLIVMMLFNNSEVKERLLEMNLFKRHQKEVD
ncbi:branched-chain amino acid ABC transporter permease [Diplocloster agilis]|uniref:branched-chain amino acid ABC transporter permease n=1 Tax=Diplocloster agilis TaxID=2850323 RepID=UPI000820776B|nr:branched-chain amino acid ABC transporter permease [Suonthocola fibrivorans]MCU6736379.1 branched-chain amino acid ABC transporter permease [Suonthocola fibrivorans]SCJ89860.1 leucine/isoleucine/valine transporter permease subunit [uncultured Clostridium sp.]